MRQDNQKSSKERNTHRTNLLVTPIRNRKEFMRKMKRNENIFQNEKDCSQYQIDRLRVNQCPPIVQGGRDYSNDLIKIRDFSSNTIRGVRENALSIMKSRDPSFVKVNGEYSPNILKSICNSPNLVKIKDINKNEYSHKGSFVNNHSDYKPKHVIDNKEKLSLSRIQKSVHLNISSKKENQFKSLQTPKDANNVAQIQLNMPRRVMMENSTGKNQKENNKIILGKEAKQIIGNIIENDISNDQVRKAYFMKECSTTEEETAKKQDYWTIQQILDKGQSISPLCMQSYSKRQSFANSLQSSSNQLHEINTTISTSRGNSRISKQQESCGYQDIQTTDYPQNCSYKSQSTVNSSATNPWLNQQHADNRKFILKLNIQSQDTDILTKSVLTHRNNSILSSTPEARTISNNAKPIYKPVIYRNSIKTHQNNSFQNHLLMLQKQNQNTNDIPNPKKGETAHPNNKIHYHRSIHSNQQSKEYSQNRSLISANKSMEKENVKNCEQSFKEFDTQYLDKSLKFTNLNKLENLELSQVKLDQQQANKPSQEEEIEEHIQTDHVSIQYQDYLNSSNLYFDSSLQNKRRSTYQKSNSFIRQTTPINDKKGNSFADLILKQEGSTSQQLEIQSTTEIIPSKSHISQYIASHEKQQREGYMNTSSHEKEQLRQSQTDFFKDQMSLLIQMNTRPFTPPFQMTSSKNEDSFIHTLPPHPEKQSIEMQVLYDDILNCYFDPKTSQYYDIKS